MTYYTIRISDESADKLITDILRDNIEADYSYEDPDLLKALVKVHNFFACPGLLMQMEFEEDA